MTSRTSSEVGGMAVAEDSGGRVLALLQTVVWWFQTDGGKLINRTDDDTPLYSIALYPGQDYCCSTLSSRSSFGLTVVTCVGGPFGKSRV